MKNFFKQWFGDSKSAPAHSQPAPSRSPWDNPLTIEDGSENATRRQLVQVLMRDVLRKSGIPPQWIDCQMLLVSSRTRGQGMYVRLVIKHWDKRLMNYAFAFQQALLADIRHFEPRQRNGCTVFPGSSKWKTAVLTRSCRAGLTGRSSINTMWPRSRPAPFLPQSWAHPVCRGRLLSQRSQIQQPTRHMISNACSRYVTGNSPGRPPNASRQS